VRRREDGRGILGGRCVRTRSVRKPDQGATQELSQHCSFNYGPFDAKTHARGDIWAFAYIAIRRLLELIVFMGRSDSTKDIELPCATSWPSSAVKSDVLRTSQLTGPCSLHAADFFPVLAGRSSE
jgi:hypothetical protein